MKKQQQPAFSPQEGEALKEDIEQWKMVVAPQIHFQADDA